MHKRLIRAAFAVLLAACLACMPGCKAEETNETLEESEDSALAGYRRTVLYYTTDDGYMVPIMKMIPWEEGIGKAALSCLINNEDNASSAAVMGLKAVIPDETTLSLRIDEGLATVDLQGLSALSSAAQEQQMVTGIVNTLTEFPTIEAVKILVDGEESVKLENGTVMPVQASGYALNVQDAEVSVSTNSAFAMTIYYPNQAASLNIPITEYTSYQPQFEDAVLAMLEGKDGLLGFPEGTSLISAGIEDNTASVDLSKDFLSVQDTEGLALALYDALFLTACEFGEVYALELTVQGEPFEIPAAPVSAPLYVNEFK